MYTARALRRLKPDPVPDALITQVLEAATQAPSGGNAQNWIFIVVRDEAQRRRLGAVYRKASDARSMPRGRPAHLSDMQYQRLMEGGAYLWQHLGDAPVLLVPCLSKRDMPAREVLPDAVAKRYEAHLDYQERIRGASIYPAIGVCRSMGAAMALTVTALPAPRLKCARRLKDVSAIPI